MTAKTSSTPVDPKFDKKIQEKLITARVGLLLRQPFYGNLATRLQLINADEWCPTAATDGRRFYYNSKFVDSLSLKETEFLFGHEIGHIIYDHMGRRGSRDPKMWNVAGDYCVNGDLIEHKVGERITKVQILHDTKYAGWPAERVYDDLQNRQDEMQKLFQQVLDEHLDEDDGMGGNGDGKDGDKEGKGGRPKISKEEADAIRDEIKEAVLQAANSVDASQIPGGVKRLIQDLTAPKIDWRSLLQQQIESVFRSDFSWTKPNRRGWHMDAIMPGMIPGTMVNVDIAIDTSGSISTQMIKEFLSEVLGIMEAYTEYKIRLWCFDTAIHNVQEYTSDNLQDIREYEPGGGGGTDFDVNWQFMKENDIQPSKFIMFTDGVPFGSWGDPDYCDTVWIINNPSKPEPPFGVWAYYDEVKTN